MWITRQPDLNATENPLAVYLSNRHKPLPMLLSMRTHRYNRPLFHHQNNHVKAHLEELISQAVLYLQRDGFLPKELNAPTGLERTRNPDHGDYASNIALVLAKPTGKPPRELAEAILNKLPDSCHLTATEIAGPGFINFFLNRHSQLTVINDILEQGDRFGREPGDPEKRVTVEFVSANPTGPLHVGHGRGAAYGASLSAIMDAAGYTVQREYYVNDNGRQMDILAISTWLRYLELCGESARFPDAGYQGEYVYDIARIVRNEHGDKMRFTGFDVETSLPQDGGQLPDQEQADEVKAAREAHIDALIARARELLGDDGFEVFFNAALDSILTDIRNDLAEFGVKYDVWFSERELEQSGAIQKAIERMRSEGHLYEKDGAVWLRAGELGDEKDRVVVRENGRTTYFASDIAYFLNKLERGFNTALYVFGSDHHGYVARLKAAAKASGEAPERLEVLLMQFAVLFRGGEKVQMSTRSGEFVTLRQLREEVGTDAARFFYVMRSHNQHLDFDLDLAKSRSNDNPVYYIQYAHARICSVFRNLEDQDLRYNAAIGEAAVDALTEDHEIQLARLLSRYPEVIEAAARAREPHLLAHYLQELAQGFHAYYNAHKVLVEEPDLRNARLNLIAATRQVIANGLELLGVSAPEEM